MAQYIDKDALVAEIEKRVGFNKALNAYSRADECNAILSFLNTIDVRKVDLEKEYKDFVEEDPVYNKLVNGIVGKNIAKHFFELGLNASNPLTWKDIDLILDITDQIANDDSMEEKLNNMSQEEYCTEVLKRFKAQKGE